MRTDGEFTIYEIEHQDSGGKWCRSSMDHFIRRGMDDCMSGSEPCWQQTSVTGTFDRTRALLLCDQIATANKGKKFRVVERLYKQETTVSAEISYIALAA